MPVIIHGAEYKTVSERTNELHEKYPENVAIRSEIVHFTEEIAVVKATVTKPDGKSFDGHAFEKASPTGVNETSHLENAETSAVGRALAFAGFGGTEIASANEVEQAIASKNKNAPEPPATPKAQAPTKGNAEYPGKGDTVGMPNKYAKTCVKCGKWVEANEGWVEKTEAGRWETRCTEEGPCTDKEPASPEGLPF